MDIIDEDEVLLPYSGQTNVGYQRTVLRNVAVGASHYYRTTKNQISRINAAIPRSVYFLALTCNVNGLTVQRYRLTTSPRRTVEGQLF